MIGKLNIIEKIVELTDNPAEMYQDKSMYELAWDLKIAKMKAGY